MAKSANALVEATLLVWARTEAHLTIEDAAKKMSVSSEKLKSWEAGTSYPTVKQLRRLAKVYRQSFAVFYLSTPPDLKRPKARDYRRLPGSVFENLSSALVFEIRDAMERREIALELYLEESISPPVFSESATIFENPQIVAKRVREILQISISKQSKFRNGRVAFNAWRQAVENAGILVFQARQVTVEEMRGFSLTETPFPVIIVNRKDAYTARCFTLIHELVHIMLNSSQLQVANTSTDHPPEDQQVEIFCNQVTASVLVPNDNFLAQQVVILHGNNPVWSDNELRRLASQYAVSQPVILRKLLSLGLTHQDFYQSKSNELDESFENRPKASGGFLPPSTDVVSAAGKPFTRLVIDAMYANRITPNDVSSYLGVRLKHLDRITELVN